MWLEDKYSDEIENMRKLIVEKGGWTQPDEACTHYNELIDQYSLGLRKLANKYGNCGVPKIGYEALFFSRMHYLELENRIKNKSLEMLWQTDENGDATRSLFTSTFYRGTYTQPKGFCFDHLCYIQDNIIDNPELEGYNIDQKLNDFLNIVNEQVKVQRHNHVLIAMGGDFTYSDAELWFNNLDKLILAGNKKKNITNVNIFYSTPTCYIKALEQTTKPNFPKRDGDFFPYADKPDRYWTGYFTSKPSLKGLTRKSSSLLQVTRALYTLMKAKTKLNSENLRMELFERSIALTTHHDAITGTSKELVTKNYMKRLLQGWDAAEIILTNTLAFLTKKEENKINKNKTLNVFPTQKLCSRLNESYCPESMGTDNFTLTILNGNSKQFSGYIRIPVNNQNIQILSNNGQQIDFRLIPLFISQSQKINQSKYELIFKANVGPVGFTTFFPNTTKSIPDLPQNSQKSTSSKQLFTTKLPNTPLNSNNNISSISPIRPTETDGLIENKYIRLNFNKNGRIESLEDLTRENAKFKFTQEFLYYEGLSSGAYIFGANSNLEPTPFNETTKTEFIKNDFVQEARQIISPWVSQIIRLFEDKKYIEFEFLVGPIPITEFKSKEIITRYSMPEINSSGIFWTDSNGRRNIQRKRNFNKYFNLGENIKYPSSANYYPITSRIALSDNLNQMSILTDRSQGGTSLNDGQIEIMVHRRCVMDDGLGVEEVLNEPGEDGNGLIIRAKHWLHFGPKTEEPSLNRILGLQLFHEPTLLFSKFSGEFNDYNNKYLTNCQLLPNY
uniref:Alpha-mannosidase n=1 Tax=Meloidogyne floridensis TaxID=298350 RepID=A0A915PCR6_9BILA